MGKREDQVDHIRNEDIGKEVHVNLLKLSRRTKD